MIPIVPFPLTRKSRSDIVKELFQLAPEKPFKTVSGFELLKELTIPLKPN